MPLDEGWYAVVVMCLQPSSLVNSRNKVDWNWLPRSVVMVDGTPNVAIQCWSSTFAIFSAEVSEMGTATGQRVKLSATVNKWVGPFDGGSGPTRST